jgi:hypothetical protein
MADGSRGFGVLEVSASTAAFPPQNSNRAILLGVDHGDVVPNEALGVTNI